MVEFLCFAIVGTLCVLLVEWCYLLLNIMRRWLEEWDI